MTESPLGSCVVYEKTAGTNRPMTARMSSAALDAAIFALNDWVPKRKPPASAAAPVTSSRFPIDRPGQRRLDDLEEPGLEREERDDELGDVAEGRVEDPADLRPGERSQPLGGRTDDPREPEDRGRRRGEHERLVRLQAELQEDRQQAEADRAQQHDPGHG